jgi:acyl-CoA thioester hydrolase
MPAVYEHLHRVRDEEIDEQGHVGNLHYLRWMQTAAVAHSAVQGWPTERYLQSGAAFVVRSHQIEYLQSAYAGQELVVLTWVSNFSKATTIRKYKVVRQDDGLVLAKAATNWALVSLKHRVPRRIPPELVEAFEVVSEDREP